jgi:hypothetical protein
MKIQDYIHYYIGCDVIIDPGTKKEDRGKLLGGTFIPNSINQIYYGIQTAEMRDNEDEDFAMPYNDDADDPARIKPILRRLANLTHDEAKHLALIYSGAKSVERTKGVADNWHYYFCYFGENEEGELLIIAADGCAWYAHYFDQEQPGHRNIVNEHKAFHYLLQQHFDLFNLIDAGLAVDAKIIRPELLNH